MKLRFDYNNTMTSYVGEHGVDPACIDTDKEVIATAFKTVMDMIRKSWYTYPPPDLILC